MCFSSARMASLALSPYFSSIASSLGQELIGISPEEGFRQRFQCELTLDLEYLSCNLAFQLLIVMSTATYLAVGSLGTTEHILGLVP